MKMDSLFGSSASDARPTRQVMFGETIRVTDDALVIYDDAAITIKHARSAGADTLIFDPPWNAIPDIDYSGFERVIAFCDGGRASDVLCRFGANVSWIYTWDCVSCWYVSGSPLRRSKLAIVYAPFADNYRLPVDRDLRPRSVSNSRGAYVYTPDAAGVRLADVYSHAITQLHRGGHKHAKPQEWINMLISNHAGSLVVDPFCGSGTTVRACIAAGVPCICGDNDRESVLMSIAGS